MISGMVLTTRNVIPSKEGILSSFATGYDNTEVKLFGNTSRAESQTFDTKKQSVKGTK